VTDPDFALPPEAAVPPPKADRQPARTATAQPRVADLEILVFELMGFLLHSSLPETLEQPEYAAVRQAYKHICRRQYLGRDVMEDAVDADPESF